ncbi:transmembrane protein, putative [Rhizoctonia solani AG-3 Rhs1AP]|uniref:Transmembrane protein, putative n=2 Tax=Rhizoctonia solani AG-3 TaxID=1086053 RepID=X8J2Q4_9AGAM|nr:transmembrane protein, putative [Rhizoctonia solani AG-3 Rhs1AP]KEP47122.1 putative transmembrane protein [Rhizoctonia solani 123E]
MSSTLATHPMSLIALVATLAIAFSHVQQFLNMILTVSVTFWEFVAPLLLILTAIIVLSVLELVVALLLIAVNSLIFRQFLNSVAAHSSRKSAAPYTALQTKSAPINNALVTSIPHPPVQPRRFKKRRPINYSGARPTPTIDPLNNPHTRLMVHIARIRSKAWRTDALKEASAPMLEPMLIPVAPAVTPLPQDDQVHNIETHFVSVVSSTLVETDLLAPRVSVKSNAVTEGQELEELVSIATHDSPLSLPGTSSKLEAGIETTGLGRSSSPASPDIETESSPFSALSVPNAKLHDSYHTDLASDSRPLPGNEQGPTLHLDLTAKVNRHTVRVSMVGQNTAETVTSIIPECAGELVVNDTGVSAAEHVCPSNLSLTLRLMGPEQQFDIPRPTPTLQSDTPVFTVTTPPSTGANSDTAPLDLPTLVYDLPAQPPATTIPDDILQAEMEMLAMPTYQDILAEMGQFFDGLVDAPPTLGTSAPTTVDQDSQLGCMRNISGTDAFNSDIGSNLIPDPIDDHEMFGLDTTTQADMALPSDAELLQLAAAALAAEGMDWVYDAAHPVATGPQNESAPTPLTDQELLELDIFLQMATDSLIPHASNETSPATNTILDSETSAILPTDDELLMLAGLDDYNAMDFDLIPGTNMCLDPSQLEPLDQATQSTITDLTNEVLGPSGMFNPNDLPTFGFTDSSSSGPQFDPNELAKMWDELGASLKGWVGQVPGAMNFSEEDMMRMLLEFDALDATCSPLHMTANKTCTSTSINPAPAVRPRRKFKKLPLRRTAIVNHARAMMSQCA